MNVIEGRIERLLKRADAAVESFCKAESYSPPQGVRSAAARGLELRAKWNRGGLSNAEASDQGIGSGVQRATNLKNGDGVSPEVIRQMNAFFSRHAKNYRPDEKESDGGPTAGTIAWLLWGGNAGKSWAAGIAAKMDVEKARTKIKGDHDGDGVPYERGRTGNGESRFSDAGAMMRGAMHNNRTAAGHARAFSSSLRGAFEYSGRDALREIDAILGRVAMSKEPATKAFASRVRSARGWVQQFALMTPGKLLPSKVRLVLADLIEGRAMVDKEGQIIRVAAA